MANSFKKMKTLKSTKYHKLIFGYIHYIQHTQSINGNIAMLIYYLCLKYYYLEEYFAQCSNGVIITNDKSTIKYQNEFNATSLYETVTCHYTTTHKRSTWNLIINKCMNRMFIIFKDNLDKQIVFKLENNACIHINKCGTHTHEDSIKWTSNDKVVLVLDMNTQTISVGLKNESLQPVINTIWKDRGYTLLIGLFNKGDSVTLNKFSSI